jgi:hypothetical protein
MRRQLWNRIVTTINAPSVLTALCSKHFGIHPHPVEAKYFDFHLHLKQCGDLVRMWK